MHDWLDSGASVPLELLTDGGAARARARASRDASCRRDGGDGRRTTASRRARRPPPRATAEHRPRSAPLHGRGGGLCVRGPTYAKLVWLWFVGAHLTPLRSRRRRSRCRPAAHGPSRPLRPRLPAQTPTPATAPNVGEALGHLVRRVWPQLVRQLESHEAIGARSSLTPSSPHTPVPTPPPPCGRRSRDVVSRRFDARRGDGAAGAGARVRTRLPPAVRRPRPRALAGSAAAHCRAPPRRFCRGTRRSRSPSSSRLASLATPTAQRASWPPTTLPPAGLRSPTPASPLHSNTRRAAPPTPEWTGNERVAPPPSAAPTRAPCVPGAAQAGVKRTDRSQPITDPHRDDVRFTPPTLTRSCRAPPPPPRAPEPRTVSRPTRRRAGAKTTRIHS